MAASPLSHPILDSAGFARGLEGFRSHFALEHKPSGVAELDALLGGGFPCGSVVEICGPLSSGRTSLVFSLLAQATRRQEACAFVDVSDSLDPLSAAAAGIELARLLWIRCSGEGNKERVPRLPKPSPAENRGKSAFPAPGSSREKPWKRLEQAIKTTDLLLHSGGWGVVVLDLGDIAWADARRIELSTWFRFRRTVENTPAILVLLGEESYAKSCASLVLQCRRKAENWHSIRPSVADDAACARTFQGFDIEGYVLRSRTGLQPGDSAHWVTHAF